ncbi:MAG: hypothetical protein M3032_05925 [Verrucomicrobiota bacterium]|nr:hypothetical protein [Verrucomicrobiota bacterium]
MKRILCAFVAFAFLIPAAHDAEARADVSIDFFYNNLSGGNWIEAGDYGYCWQPGVGASNANWRPYTDGYWGYSDVGWTWVSYEDFGWATYHYGRWARLNDYGWVWVPGTEWGPSWVSWRTGGDYVGWAPLPPRGGRERIYEGRAINGAVDIDFDIGPAFYNFVDVRYIGEPVLRERIFDVSQNVGYIDQTVNVTNITYRNGAVYNYGPDYQTLSAYSTRPIQRFQVERQANVDLATALQSGAVTKVEGDRFIVASPQRISAAAQGAAPKEVKGKVKNAKFETGWNGVNDPQAKMKLQEKIRKENAKNVPPPQVQPTNPAMLSKGKGKKKDGGAAAPQFLAPEKAKGHGKHAAAQGGPAIPNDAPSSLTAKGNGHGRGEKRMQLDAPAAQPKHNQQAVPQQHAQSAPVMETKHGKAKHDVQAPPQMQVARHGGGGGPKGHGNAAPQQQGKGGGKPGKEEKEKKGGH